jgi:hypothetical protein
MKKASFFLLILSFLLISHTVFAEATISSEINQLFQQNQSTTTLKGITITDDDSEPIITAGEIKITIPDTLKLLFYIEKTADDIMISGSAVDNERVKESPNISFENNDKTLVILIDEDFEAGEEMLIKNLYIEGFHSATSNPHYLELNINGQDFLDDKKLEIDSSIYDDNYVPQRPTNVLVEDYEDEVVISWENPTDLDLQGINIYRGKNDVLISGVPYAILGAEIEEYIDTDVKIGDTVKYTLKAFDDSQNFSRETKEIVFEVGVVEEVVEEEEEESEEEVVEEEIVEEEIAEEEDFAPLFLDTKDHWAVEMITAMAELELVEGDADERTFRPEDSLNRAEAAKMLYGVLGVDDPKKPRYRSFADISNGSWHAGYIYELKALELINGYEDKTYKPKNNISRAEFLSLAMKVYYYLNDEAAEELEITDAYQDLGGGEWYAGDVTAATELGFIGGRVCEGGKCFNAEASITRAEATKILYEMFY